MGFFLCMAMEVQHFPQFILCKNKRITFNGAKCKMKVDSNENLTGGFVVVLSGGVLPEPQ